MTGASWRSGRRICPKLLHSAGKAASSKRASPGTENQAGGSSYTLAAGRTSVLERIASGCGPDMAVHRVRRSGEHRRSRTTPAVATPAVVVRCAGAGRDGQVGTASCLLPWRRLSHNQTFIWHMPWLLILSDWGMQKSMRHQLSSRVAQLPDRE